VAVVLGVCVLVVVGVCVDSSAVCPIQVCSCASLFVPSGQVVFDHVNEAIKSDRNSVVLRRLAPVRFVSRTYSNVPPCRLAPVKST
jgi:hypothetical protein